MFGAAKAQQKLMQDLPTQFMQVGKQWVGRACPSYFANL
jgi:hypothetical protein